MCLLCAHQLTKGFDTLALGIRLPQLVVDDATGFPINVQLVAEECLQAEERTPGT